MSVRRETRAGGNATQRRDWALGCGAGVLAILLVGLTGCIIVPFVAGLANEYVKQSSEGAMREAAFMVTSGFREVPEVRRWLREQGI